MGMDPLKLSHKHIYPDLRSAVLSVIRIFGPCHRTAIMTELKSFRASGQLTYYEPTHVRMILDDLFTSKLIKPVLPDVWEDINGNCGNEFTQMENT